MTDFRVPEFDKDGNKTSQLTGDFAKIKDNGEVDVTNLRIELYKDGKVETLMTSPQCTYNQEKGVAYSRAAVRMERDNLTVTGTGFAYSHTNMLFKIFSEARVVLKSVREDRELLGAKHEK